MRLKKSEDGECIQIMWMRQPIKRKPFPTLIIYNTIANRYHILSCFIIYILPIHIYNINLSDMNRSNLYSIYMVFAQGDYYVPCPCFFFVS